MRLIDASFIWTEPHSKRIKIKLVVQKEIQVGAILEQSSVTEFTIQELYTEFDIFTLRGFQADKIITEFNLELKFL